MPDPPALPLPHPGGLGFIGAPVAGPGTHPGPARCWTYFMSSIFVLPVYSSASIVQK